MLESAQLPLFPIGGNQTQELIAPVQDTLIAKQNYEVGQQFILGGVLFTVIKSGGISEGDTINMNTDVEASDKITDQINDIGNTEIITLTDYDSTTMHIEYQNCWKSGHVVHVMARIKQLKAISNNIIATETLPKPKCAGNYYYGIGFVYRNAALRNIDVLNAAIQKSTGYLRWNGGTGQANDILQIQCDYCTDE